MTINTVVFKDLVRLPYFIPTKSILEIKFQKQNANVMLQYENCSVSN